MVLNQAKKYLLENWGIGVCGTGLAAEVIGMNADTLKTKVATGRAPAIKYPGDVRQKVSFGGEHLVHNLLIDTLSKFRITLDGDHDHIVRSYVQKIKDEVLEGDNTNAAMVISSDGRAGWLDINQVHPSDFEDIVVIVPLSRLVLQMAVALFVRQFPGVAASVLR